MGTNKARVLNVRIAALTLLLGGVIGAGARADDPWPATLTPHSVLQAVSAGGGSAYVGGFPIVMRGVLLNSPGDLLDSSANFLPYSPANAWNLGGQWQVFFQSVAPGDFGGTAAWMGQNYGNLGFIRDTAGSYTDAAWLSELDRLNHDSASGRAFRSGDLIEVRARTGLYYAGKFNVNEAHDVDAANNFDVVLVQADYGLPSPAAVSLSDVKDAANLDIFDPARATGGERYQGTWVRIDDVHLQSAVGWGPLGEVVLADDAGLTLPMVLGSSRLFATTSPPAGTFDVVGIFDQEGGDNRGGYRLWVADPAQVLVPEPGACLLLAAFALLCARRRLRADRQLSLSERRILT